MKATWHDTGNTVGDVCAFPDALAAQLVAKGIAAYVDEPTKPGQPKPKATHAPPVDKMVKPASVEKKSDEALPPIEDEKPKPVRRRRRRTVKPPAAEE
jgi:hypothetical protein